MDESLPKAPTRAEILEDLGTFCMDRTLLDASKRRPSAASAEIAALASNDDSPKATGAEQDANLERWWNKFETFLSEIDDLDSYRKQFDAKRENLTKLDVAIRVLSQAVHTEISKSVQSALDEASDNGSDLK